MMDAYFGVISTIICLGLMAAFTTWILTLFGVIKTPRQLPRGFEVKPSTGGTPVPREENDAG